MMKNIVITLLLFGLSMIFYEMVVTYYYAVDGGVTFTHYVTKGVEELGAVNLVTSVIVGYRGFDTLGEVTVLFLTASVLSFFLKKNLEQNKNTPSEIISTASKVMFPFIFITGVHILINGHLTPGGGFQGGAIIASAFLFRLLADYYDRSGSFFSFIESFSGLTYVLAGVAGYVWAGGFLDVTLLGQGVAGELLSAGLIPVISVVIGIKVGAEISILLLRLKNNIPEN